MVGTTPTAACAALAVASNVPRYPNGIGTLGTAPPTDIIIHCVGANCVRPMPFCFAQGMDATPAAFAVGQGLCSCRCRSDMWNASIPWIPRSVGVDALIDPMPCRQRTAQIQCPPPPTTQCPQCRPPSLRPASRNLTRLPYSRHRRAHRVCAWIGCAAPSARHQAAQSPKWL